MVREFEINDDWEVITAERDRIIFGNNKHQLFVITPTSIKGTVEQVYDDITCLTFELDERLNLELWREISSNVYCDGEQLSEGEYWDMFCVQHERIMDLTRENERLRNELFEVSKDYLIETSDYVDRALYVEDEIKELAKELGVDLE